MWLKELEIALVEQDVASLERLLQADLSTLQKEELQNAAYLLLEAKKLLEQLKEQTAQTMQKLKKNSDFLKVSQIKNSHRLDIRS
jgi:phage-related minor tail protein